MSKKVSNEVKVTYSLLGKGIASLGVCALGYYSMLLSDGQTGVGWAMLGLFIVWGL